MEEVSERILLYLSQVDKASNKEIAEALNINHGIISKKLQHLQDEGLIKVVEQEGRTKYYALVTSTQPSVQSDNTTVIKLDMSKIKSLSQLRDTIN